MKRAHIFYLVIAAVVSAAALGYGGDRYLHHREFVRACRAAQRSFYIAWQFKGIPGSEFGQRFDAFEDDLAVVRNMDAVTEGDEERYLEIKTCESYLDIYRSLSRQAVFVQEDGKPVDKIIREMLTDESDAAPCFAGD